jgi:hypothetical protein
MFDGVHAEIHMLSTAAGRRPRSHTEEKNATGKVALTKIQAIFERDRKALLEEAEALLYSEYLRGLKIREQLSFTPIPTTSSVK